jgi:hypothetical protein
VRRVEHELTWRRSSHTGLFREGVERASIRTTRGANLPAAGDAYSPARRSILSIGVCPQPRRIVM